MQSVPSRPETDRRGRFEAIAAEVYRGVDAGAVTLVAPEGLEALIGGVAWEVGRPYLVSASDGVVNYCGQTGPATPELQVIYDAAFAG